MSSSAACKGVPDTIPEFFNKFLDLFTYASGWRSHSAMRAAILWGCS